MSVARADFAVWGSTVQIQCRVCLKNVYLHIFHHVVDFSILRVFTIKGFIHFRLLNDCNSAVLSLPRHIMTKIISNCIK